MEIKAQKFFLGANSCEGFVSYFEDSYISKDGFRAILIKGGPGTGKSSLMKYVAAAAKERGLEVVLCPCSSDPQSLDGVIIPQKSLVLLDATSPHTVDPALPGACEEILNLGEFWDGNMLFEDRKEIAALSKKNKCLHRAAARYLKAVGEVMNEQLGVYQAHTDYGKLYRFTNRLCERILPPPAGKTGRNEIRFIQGIGPEGIIGFSDSVTDYYDNIIAIDDKIGNVSTEIIKAVLSRANAAGLDTITLKNPFLPSELTDHILIPELSLAVVREDGFMQFKTGNRRVHTRRFVSLSGLKPYRNRMIFSRRVIRELLSTATEILRDAKSVHDELERRYVAAMDFGAMSSAISRLTDRILGE